VWCGSCIGGAQARMAMTNTLDKVTDAERANWQSFYADRNRRCPFFVLAPDENLVEWVQEGRFRPGRALDIGCGNARNAIYLAQHGFTVDAVDHSASGIDWAREAVSKANAPVSVHRTSIFDFHAPAASYDFVYDSGCFHHIPPHQRGEYVQLVSNALKPGAAFGLVCFTPEGGSGRTDDDVYAQGSLGWGLGYDEARLREIWREAFDIQIFRRMRELPSNAGIVGKGFLWTLLLRRH
jgi:SAM-dependent methyltransferase